MAFFELNDVFGYQDANDIKKLWADAAEPAAPGDGEIWLDTSVEPYKLKRYNGTGWDIIAGGITLTSDGKFGIGTETPLYPFHLITDDTTNASVVVERTNGAAGFLNATATHANIGSVNNFPVRMHSNNVARMLLDTNGNIGMGTETPDYHLEVERTGESVLIVAKRTDGAQVALFATDLISGVSSLSNHPLQFNANGTWKMRLNTDESVEFKNGVTMGVSGDITVPGDLTASEQLIIPTSQPTVLQNGSIWIA